LDASSQMIVSSQHSNRS